MGGGKRMRMWTREELYRPLKEKAEIADLHDYVSKSAYRQAYHVQPVTGLLNDPNGFILHKSVWHLFYQWCPWGAVHGIKYWYHVVSKDLIQWKNAGICIRPDTDMDNYGAYSGSAISAKDAICLFYTGNHRDPDFVRKPKTCLVKLYDDGRTAKLPWPLFDENPAYTENQRDPKIIYVEEKKSYYMLLGAQNAAMRGCVLVYESANLVDGWFFAGSLHVPGFEDFGDMWECPSIERICGRDVLMFCPQHIYLPRRGKAVNHSGYILGEMDWDRLVFTPSGSFHVLDFGFDFYAAECAANFKSADHTYLTAWMGLPDGSYPTDEEGWQGCLTLPRELSVRDRRLIQKPLPGLADLRNKEVRPSEMILPESCEMMVMCSGGDLELRLFTRKDLSGGLVISYQEEFHMITVDRSGMNLRINPEQGEIRQHLIDNELTQLRVFIDRSSVEIFVNEGDAVFTARVFPTEEEGNFYLSPNANARIWTLKSAVVDDFCA